MHIHEKDSYVMISALPDLAGLVLPYYIDTA